MAFMHPRFRHTFIYARSYMTCALQAGYAHIRHTRMRESEFSQNEHDSAPNDIKSRRRRWYGHSAFNELTRARPLGVSPDAYGIN